MLVLFSKLSCGIAGVVRIYQNYYFNVVVETQNFASLQLVWQTV